MPVRLQPPESVSGKLFSSNVSVFVVIHLLALLALIPELFTWTGVALVFVGNFVFGGLGINIGYHRLLVHRSFRCPKWLEHTFAVLGACCLQDSPTRWIAIHRLHHKHTDRRPDPHSPSVSYFWSHLGWLVFKNRNLRRKSTLEKYARDLMQDPFYVWLHEHRRWLYLYAAHGALFLALGCLVGWAMTRDAAEALRFGLSVFVWGVLVRTVYVWHVTWASNAVCHLWGYRNYETGDNSTNNVIISLVTSGEGWHNNHHASPRSASHGHYWWELDLMFVTIRLLQKVGLASNILSPHSSPRFSAAAQRRANKRLAISDSQGVTHRADAGSKAETGPRLERRSFATKRERLDLGE
jgi:stearoyl-CoA desaturase (delta-9 desaturase)